MYDYYDWTLRKNIPKTPNLFRRYLEKHRGPYPNSSYFMVQGLELMAGHNYPKLPAAGWQP